MRHYQQALEIIDDGRLGKNEGLFHGLSRATRYLPNIQKGNIYLIGGISGSGKSALGMDMFVYNAYDDYMTKRDRVKLKIFIFSIEISPEILIAKGICRRIYKDHGILVDLNYILSRGTKRIDDHIYRLIRQYEPYFEEFEDRVIINGQENPTGIRNTVYTYLKNHGVRKMKVITIKHKDGSTETLEAFDRYIPDDEGQHVILMIDHLNIMRSERREGIVQSKKQNIDKMMEYSLDFARDYKVTVVPIQQLNRNIENVDRMKMSSVDPQKSDFKESSDSTDASHYILGLCYPQAWSINEYRRYRIDELGNRFRGVKILKNRDGDADIVFGTKFIGEVGVFEELPPSVPRFPGDTMPLMTDKDYQNIKKLTKYYKE